MNKKTFYNLMCWLPSIVLLLGYIIWVEIETMVIFLILGIIFILIILWERYWIDKSYKNDK